MAKRTIANLNIKLGAQTASLKRDFGRASGMAGGYANDIAAIAKKVAVAFAGMFALGQAKAAIGEQMQMIGGLKKLSAQTGFAVENLSRLQYAASQLSIDRDDMTGAIEELNIRLGEAVRDGTGPLAETFQRLNLDAAKLAQLPLPERFGAIANAIAGIDNAALRQFSADEIFGGDAFKIMGLLEQGADGIRALTAESDAFGRTISTLDATKVADANRAINRMTEAGRGLLAEVTVKLAPAITAVTSAITELTVWLSNLDPVTLGNTARIVGFTVAFVGVVKLIPTIVAGIRLIITTLQALASAQAITSALSGPAGWAKLAIGAGVAAGAVYGVSQAFDNATSSADKAAASATAGGNATEASYAAAAAAVGDTAAGLDEAKKKAEELSKQGQQMAESLRTPAEEYQAAMGKARELFAAGAISGEIFSRAARKAREDFQQAYESANKIQQVTKTQGAAALQRGTTAAFSAIQSGIRDRRHQIALARQRNQHLAAMNARLAAIDRNTKDQIKIIKHQI